MYLSSSLSLTLSFMSMAKHSEATLTQGNHCEVASMLLCCLDQGDGGGCAVVLRVLQVLWSRMDVWYIAKSILTMKCLCIDRICQQRLCAAHIHRDTWQVADVQDAVDVLHNLRESLHAALKTHNVRTPAGKSQQ
jgi:hypothetical protein